LTSADQRQTLFLRPYKTENGLFEYLH
jgi:hypothetical protein